MIRKKFLSLLIFIVALFCGCVPPEFTFRALPEDPSSPVTIAAFLPLTGKNRIYAEQMQEGLTAARDRINNYNGINGRPVNLLILDTKGTPEGSDAAWEAAVSQGAIAAIAGYSTREAGLLARQASRRQIPTIVPTATGDDLSEISPFVYRNCFTDRQQMEVLAAYLFHWRQLQIGAIITDLYSDDEYARNIARNFAQAVQDNGNQITVNTVIPAGGSLSTAQTADLLATAPQFILVASRGKRAAEIFRKLREGGFHGVLCGPDSLDDQNFISALGDIEPGDTVFTALFSEENNSMEFKKFSREFRKEFYHLPGACESQSYDALLFLAIALENASDLLKFERNWCTIRNHAGAAATYTMLPKGGIDRTIYLKSLGVSRQDDKLLIYSRLSRQLQYSKIKDYRIIE